MLADIEENDRKFWALLVKRLFSNLGFYKVSLQHNVGDVKAFNQWSKKDYKIILSKIGMQNYMNLLELLFFYRQIATFQSSDNLEILSIKKFRIALTKLRASSHRLEIEIGTDGRDLNEMSLMIENVSYVTN